MKKYLLLLSFATLNCFAQTKLPIQLLNPSGSTSGQVIESTGATTAPAWTTITLFSYPGAGIPNSTGSAWGSSYSTTGTGTVVLNTAPTLSGLLTTGSLKANATISGSASSGAINYGSLNYSDTNLFESYQTNVNSYAQSIWQNTNSGATASTDLVLSNDQGTSTTHYANLGINSSGFTGAGSLNLPGASYLTGTTSDLVLGTTTANAIHFVANGATSDAITISSGNIPTINSASMITPALGTPASGVITNLSGTCASCSIGGNAATATSATTATTATNLSGGTVSATTIAASGITTISNGSSTNPSLNFAGASLTGLYYTGSGVGFSVSGATAGNISATGLNNMAIGATTASTIKATTIGASGLITPTYPAGILGNATGSAVSAGSTGETIVGTGTAVSLTSAASTTIASVALSAGDWQITVAVSWAPAATTISSSFFAGISATTNALPVAPLYTNLPISVAAGVVSYFSVPVVSQRVLTSGTPTYYCVAGAVFTTSTMTATCTITATRR